MQTLAKRTTAMATRPTIAPRTASVSVFHIPIEPGKSTVYIPAGAAILTAQRWGSNVLFVLADIDAPPTQRVEVCMVGTGSAFPASDVTGYQHAGSFDGWHVFVKPEPAHHD